jgi:hypothetical protein
MLAIIARVRPTRSAITPKSSPPAAEATKVNELSAPAIALLMPNVFMRLAIINAYSVTSIASSIQPRPLAISDWRSAKVTCAGQVRPKIRRVGLEAVTSLVDKKIHLGRAVLSGLAGFQTPAAILRRPGPDNPSV